MHSPLLAFLNSIRQHPYALAVYLMVWAGTIIGLVARWGI